MMTNSTQNQDNTAHAMKAKWASLKMDISKVKKWSKAIACFCLVSLLPAHSINAATYLFHNDHLGTPQVLTDNNQQVVWQSEQDPFGEVSEVVNVVEQNLRFPGQYFDLETELSYNYFRSYDSTIGRYMTSDPIGLAGGINTYGYVGGNSINRVDPTGLFWPLVVAPFVGGGATTVGGITTGQAIIGGVATGILLSTPGDSSKDNVVPGQCSANDNNNNKCNRLREKAANLRKEIYEKRIPEIDSNPGNLPEYIGPGERYRDTVRGHRILLLLKFKQLHKLEDQIARECGGN